jgi:1-phosphofructokinase
VIVTVTANPSVDLTMAVAARPNGDVQRARWVLVEPSGKGVNVAVALHRCGRDVTAVLPLGRGTELRPMLDALDLRYVGVDVAGSVRTNVTLVADDGTTSKVNEAGAALTSVEATALVEASLSHSGPGDWVAWCGSLPGGFDGGRLADAVAAARSGGRLVAVDTSQAALAAVLARPAERLPHLIKPNAAELAELTGRGFATLGDVADAAVELVERGVRTVLVSLGPDGAVLVDRDTARHGAAEHGTARHGTTRHGTTRHGTTRHGVAAADRVVNTAGAGDAFLAGYLWAAGAADAEGDVWSKGVEGAEADERLASALRFGAAAVAQAGTLFAPPPAFGPAHVGAVERDRPLSEPVPAPSR